MEEYGSLERPSFRLGMRLAEEARWTAEERFELRGERVTFAESSRGASASPTTVSVTVVVVSVNNGLNCVNVVTGAGAKIEVSDCFKGEEDLGGGTVRTPECTL